MQPTQAETDLQSLTNGVAKVAKPGLPGIVSAVGKDAIPFLICKDGQTLAPVASAGRLGKGRVAAFGHGGYLTTESADEGDTGKLLTNVVQWCSGRASKPRVGFLAGSSIRQLVTKLGFEGVPLNRATLSDDLKRADVAIIPADSDISVLESYVRNGGGLITAHTPWGWMQLNPGKDLATEMPMQSLLHKAGLSFSDGTADQIWPAKSLTESQSCNAEYALAHLDTDGAQSSSIIMAVLRSTVESDPFQKAVRAKCASAGNRIPTAQKPLQAKDAVDRLALTIRSLDRANGRPVPKIEPSANDFPGAVPTDASRVDATVLVRVSKQEWSSTGLYAAPGEEITVEAPASMIGQGFSVQIGCHSDQLWGLDKWERHPSIVTRKRIEKGLTRISSPFGGLVYIVVDKKLGLPDQKAEFGNVIRSARYVHGKTTKEEWAKQLRYAAPWAEIGSDKLIFSVPIDAARKVEDPIALMNLWDKCIDLYSDLDGSPVFDRPERIVCDRQISAGYMHSGYPIMTWMDKSVPLSLDVHDLTTEGTWGHWHELGHNRQKGEWTFSGTGEVTNNIFTLYMMDKIAGKTIWDRIGSETPKFKAYIEKGGDFNQWKSEPFLALYMYGQLIQDFGWDSMKKYFRSYEGPNAGTQPRNDMEKHDQFLIHYSRVVGKNLGPFFQAWAVPTSQAARDSVKELPKWLPKDFPKSPNL